MDSSTSCNHTVNVLVNGVIKTVSYPQEAVPVASTISFASVVSGGYINTQSTRPFIVVPSSCSGQLNPRPPVIVVPSSYAQQGAPRVTVPTSTPRMTSLLSPVRFSPASVAPNRTFIALRPKIAPVLAGSEATKSATPIVYAQRINSPTVVSGGTRLPIIRPVQGQTNTPGSGGSTLPVFKAAQVIRPVGQAAHLIRPVGQVIPNATVTKGVANTSSEPRFIVKKIARTVPISEINTNKTVTLMGTNLAAPSQRKTVTIKMPVSVKDQTFANNVPSVSATPKYSYIEVKDPETNAVKYIQIRKKEVKPDVPIVVNDDTPSPEEASSTESFRVIEIIPDEDDEDGISTSQESVSVKEPDVEPGMSAEGPVPSDEPIVSEQSCPSQKSIAVEESDLPEKPLVDEQLISAQEPLTDEEHLTTRELAEGHTHKELPEAIQGHHTSEPEPTFPQTLQTTDSNINHYIIATVEQESTFHPLSHASESSCNQEAVHLSPNSQGSRPGIFETLKSMTLEEASTAVAALAFPPEEPQISVDTIQPNINGNVVLRGDDHVVTRNDESDDDDCDTCPLSRLVISEPYSLQSLSEPELTTKDSSEKMKGKNVAKRTGGKPHTVHLNVARRTGGRPKTAKERYGIDIKDCYVSLEKMYNTKPYVKWVHRHMLHILCCYGGKPGVHLKRQKKKKMVKEAYSADVHTPVNAEIGGKSLLGQVKKRGRQRKYVDTIALDDNGSRKTEEMGKASSRKRKLEVQKQTFSETELTSTTDVTMKHNTSTNLPRVISPPLTPVNLPKFIPKTILVSRSQKSPLQTNSSPKSPTSLLSPRSAMTPSSSQGKSPLSSPLVPGPLVARTPSGNVQKPKETNTSRPKFYLVKTSKGSFLIPISQTSQSTSADPGVRSSGGHVTSCTTTTSSSSPSGSRLSILRNSSAESIGPDAVALAQESSSYVASSSSDKSEKSAGFGAEDRILQLKEKVRLHQAKLASMLKK